jgi:hypothetical protein
MNTQSFHAPFIKLLSLHLEKGGASTRFSESRMPWMILRSGKLAGFFFGSKIFGDILKKPTRRISEA